MVNPGDLSLQLSLDVPPEWEGTVDPDVLHRAGEMVLWGEGIGGPVEVEVLVVDDEEIRGLNRRYRGLDEATDVLSFPLRDEGETVFVGPPDGVLRLGDIVISFPRALAQSEEYGHSLTREIAYLFVHGLLHLLGYDHEEEVQREVMRSKEEAALARVGLSR